MGPESDTPPVADDRQSSGYPGYPGATDPRPPRPPLTKRLRRGHWIAFDCVIGVIAALCGAATVGAGWGAWRPHLSLIMLFMAVVFVPVALRRRAPLAAYTALVIVGVLLAGLPTPVSGLLFLAEAYVLYTVTVESRRRTGITALAVALGSMIAIALLKGSATPGHEGGGVFVPIALANVIAWMTGYSVRQRRRYLVTLQQQAASSAVGEERLRIARELHDVVAHSMSVIAVQAGYGQYVMDTSPDGARQALGAIQATSRDALEEMRRMLGVLRQQDGQPAPEQGPASPSARPGERAAEGESATADRRGSTTGTPASGGEWASTAPLAPAPGLSSLGRLVERTNGAGVRVRLEVSGSVRTAPAGVDLSAYRIIQEALTNVVKHAGTGAVAVVSVCYSDAELAIRVTDDGRSPVQAGQPEIRADGTGHGIIGMRERVNLCGGTFGAGPRPDGGFQVAATLPLPAVVPAGPESDAPPVVSLPASLPVAGALSTALAEGRSGRA